MKLSHILTASLAGCADALKFMENDVLAAEGMIKLGIHVAKNGLPSPGTCTLDKVSIRREWSVSHNQRSQAPLTWLQGNAVWQRENCLYRRRQLPSQAARKDTSFCRTRCEEPL